MADAIKSQARWIAVLGTVGGLLFGSMEAMSFGLDVYHTLRDEMITDNMQVIEDYQAAIDELKERIEALEEQP